MTFMAEKKSIKVTQISKDFNLKTKDLTDVFKEIGFEKKNSSATVEAEEYAVLGVE